MNNIIWLASYPKSGNTWFRTFISNLIHEKEEDVTINNLKTDGIFSSRVLFDGLTGIEASDLTFNEIDRLRPQAYNYLAQNLQKNLYIKVHDAYTYLEDNTPLLGTVNARAIYIIRNPLDVAVSFSNHLSQTLNKAIELMGNPGYAFCKSNTGLKNQLRQNLLSWSGHAESWVSATEIEVLVIRYEDMKFDSLNTFKSAVEFIGLDFGNSEIEVAIAKSDFYVLKKQEEKDGFKEKPSHTNSFFRKGQVGDWRNHLTNEQADKIIVDHQETMKKYGYLDDNNQPVY